MERLDIFYANSNYLSELRKQLIINYAISWLWRVNRTTRPVSDVLIQGASWTLPTMLRFMEFYTARSIFNSCSRRKAATTMSLMPLRKTLTKRPHKSLHKKLHKSLHKRRPWRPSLRNNYHTRSLTVQVNQLLHDHFWFILANQCSNCKNTDFFYPFPFGFWISLIWCIFIGVNITWLYATILWLKKNFSDFFKISCYFNHP